jgi:hypothetical protein
MRIRKPRFGGAFCFWEIEMSANMLTETGLIYDIFGAGLLAFAVISNTTEKIAELVSTNWNYNKQAIPAFVEERNDGIVGLALLFTGFVLQALSGVVPPERDYFFAGMIVLVCLLALYLGLRRRLIERGTKPVVEFLEGKTQAK